MITNHIIENNLSGKTNGGKMWKEMERDNVS